VLRILTICVYRRLFCCHFYSWALLLTDCAQTQHHFISPNTISPNTIHLTQFIQYYSFIHGPSRLFLWGLRGDQDWQFHGAKVGLNLGPNNPNRNVPQKLE